MTDNDITVGQLIGAAAMGLAQRNLKEPVATVELNYEMKRLISVFGAGAVRDAVALATKGKVGRKQEQDWPLLGEVIKQDAHDWLDGKNPLKVRSNYAVAVAQVVSVVDTRLGKIIQNDADRHLGKFQRYHEVIGEPAADMTILQIETDLDNMIARRAAACLAGPAGRPAGLMRK